MNKVAFTSNKNEVQFREADDLLDITFSVEYDTFAEDDKSENHPHKVSLKVQVESFKYDEEIQKDRNHTEVVEISFVNQGSGDMVRSIRYLKEVVDGMLSMAQELFPNEKPTNVVQKPYDVYDDGA